MALSVSVGTNEWITQRRDPDDSWDQDNTAQEITDVTVGYHTDVDESSYNHYGMGASVFESNATNGDTVYVVIAVYDTGNTFGRQEGEFQVMDVFENEWDAQTFRNHLNEFHVSDSYRWWRDESRKKIAKGDEFSCKHFVQQYYIPWNGYFEHLTDIKIAQVVVGHGMWL